MNMQNQQQQQQQQTQLFYMARIVIIIQDFLLNPFAFEVHNIIWSDNSEQKKKLNEAKFEKNLIRYF